MPVIDHPEGHVNAVTRVEVRSEAAAGDFSAVIAIHIGFGWRGTIHSRPLLFIRANLTSIRLGPKIRMEFERTNLNQPWLVYDRALKRLRFQPPPPPVVILATTRLLLKVYL